MTENTPLPRLPFRISALATRKATRFALRPDADERKAIAEAMGLLDLPAFTFVGQLQPEGRRDFRLTGELQANVAQACVVSLVPVPARITETVTRVYLADYTEPTEEEAEMMADETEPLPEEIDVVQVAVEALALSLPPFPRAPGAELGEAVFAAPGVSPLRQADLNPFAGLAGLAEKMKDRGE